MRVISGTCKGRRLKIRASDRLRPTADRVRAAIFDILHLDLLGKKILDLYAGTGAMGIEALSRGGHFAVFVDSGRDSVKLIKQNLESLGLEHESLLMNKKTVPALKLLAAEGMRFDLVFMDPPYQSDDAERAMKTISELDILSPAATLVVEHETGREPADGYGRLTLYDRRRYGGTAVSFYRFEEKES